MHTILHSTTPINWDFLNIFWRSNTLHMSKNDNFVCAPRRHTLSTTYALGSLFFLYVPLEWSHIPIEKHAHLGRAGRQTQWTILCRKQKIIWNKWNSVSKFKRYGLLLESRFFFSGIMSFWGSPNFGGHRLIVSCKQSSDRLLFRATCIKIYKRLRLSWIKLYQFNIGWDTPSPIQFLILFPPR